MTPAPASGSSLGYPQGSTLFYPVWLYQQGFQYFAMGYASAMAVVLFVVALAVTGACCWRPGAGSTLPAVR